MRTSWIHLAVIATLAAARPVRADAEFDALQKAYERAEESWQAQSRDDKSSAKSAAHPSEEFLPKFRTFAEKQSRKPQAVPALTWIIFHYRDAGGERDERRPDAFWALERLTKDHAADPALASVMPALRTYEYDLERAPLEAFYEKVLRTNKQPDIKNEASVNLALLLSRAAARTEDESKAAADRRRAVQLLRGLAKGNSANGGSSEAENLLYDLEHLQVGMKAPEVTGTDPNGKTIKLSQLRGKVVVLYFWGFW